MTKTVTDCSYLTRHSRIEQETLGVMSQASEGCVCDHAHHPLTKDPLYLLFVLRLKLSDNETLKYISSFLSIVVLSGIPVQGLILCVNALKIA